MTGKIPDQNCKEKQTIKKTSNKVLNFLQCHISRVNVLSDWEQIETPGVISVNLTEKSLFITSAYQINSGDEKQLVVDFKDSKNNAGGFFIDISETYPRYSFKGCTSAEGETVIDLPQPLPAVDEEGFRIFKVDSYGINGLKISCNNEQILTFEPSTELCATSNAWTRDKSKVKFGYFENGGNFSTATQSFGKNYPHFIICFGTHVSVHKLVFTMLVPRLQYVNYFLLKG